MKYTLDNTHISIRKSGFFHQYSRLPQGDYEVCCFFYLLTNIQTDTHRFIAHPQARITLSPFIHKLPVTLHTGRHGKLTTHLNETAKNKSTQICRQTAREVYKKDRNTCNSVFLWFLSPPRTHTSFLGHMKSTT